MSCYDGESGGDVERRRRRGREISMRHPLLSFSHLYVRS